MRGMLGLLVLALMFGAPIARAADIREDMVALDRAWIPALVLASEARADLALKAMRVARSRWAAFKDRYYTFKTTDADWRRDFDRVDALIWEAHTIIDGGRQVTLARESLERVNRIMTNLRRRNGIDHFFDHVNAFREPLDAITVAAQDTTPATDAVDRIRASFATARSAWERVRSAEPGTGYRLTSAEREAINTRLGLQTAALEALGKALAAGDRAAIIASAVATRPPFAALYNSFGDFHGLLWEGA